MRIFPIISPLADLFPIGGKYFPIGGKYFPIDLISVKKKNQKTIVWFIQVSKYFTDIDDIEKKYLARWAKKVGAKAILAWTHEKRSKFDPKRGKWQFYNLTDDKELDFNKH